MAHLTFPLGAVLVVPFDASRRSPARNPHVPAGLQRGTPGNGMAWRLRALREAGQLLAVLAAPQAGFSHAFRSSLARTRLADPEET